MTSKISRDAISRLRARMIEDMTISGFAAKTQVDYVRCVKRFAAFLGRAPDTATPEEIRRFQFALREDGMSPSAINAIVSALRFFFKVTLGRPDIDRWAQFVREPSRLPVILAQEEVARLIDCAPGPGLKYKAVLSVAYGAGLRVSEVAALKISDIDRERMLIRIPVPVASSRNGRLRLSLRADLYVAPSPTDEFIDAVAPRNEAQSKDVVDRPREITPARLDAER